MPGGHLFEVVQGEEMPALKGELSGGVIRGEKVTIGCADFSSLYGQIKI